MTTVTELLGDLGPGLDRELQRLLPHQGGLVRRRIVDAVGSVTDIDVGSLALDAWGKYDELRWAARRTSQPGAAPERVRLAEHTITSAHRSTVEVYVNGARIATLGVDVEIELDVHVLDAEIAAGRLASVHAGDLDTHARLSVEGHPVVERERSFDVGALIALRHPVPLVADSPVPEPRRDVRSSSWGRAALTVAVLVAAFTLGGVVTQSVDWASALPFRAGTAAEVRSGSEWFVRSGPARTAQAVGTVAPGQQLRVECLVKGWAKLLTPPHTGRYVYSRGLELTSTPPACVG